MINLIGPLILTKRRVRIDLAYDGSAYVGWQLQPNGLSVQQRVEEGLEKLTGVHSRITASGRTDAGVHAERQPCHTDIESRLSDAELCRGLDALLPPDIAPLSVVTVPPTWHARHDAQSKTYRYRILNRQQRSVFVCGRTWHVRHPLDSELMRSAAAYLVGEHDFKSFQSSGCAAKTTVRAITTLAIERQGEEVVITVTGSGFLKQMVRTIVGTLVEVGRGKRPAGWVADVRDAKDRNVAGPCAPAWGLALVEVRY